MESDHVAVDWNLGTLSPFPESFVAIATKLHFEDAPGDWAGPASDQPPDAKLLTFEFSGVPELPNISLVMDMKGMVTSDHPEPIAALKAIVRWIAGRPWNERFHMSSQETLARLLISHLIVQKEF